MTEPNSQPQHARLRSEIERLTSEYNLPVEPEAPVYAPEPLFNKGRMAIWAAIALAVWLAVRLVVPVVVESTKAAIGESIKEAQTTAGPDGKVIITRNGRVIRITTEPATPAAAAAAALPAAAAPRSELPPPVTAAPAPAQPRR